MEAALRIADKQNGASNVLPDPDPSKGHPAWGDIGLPYWDWSDMSKRDVVPSIIRKHFGQMPNGLVTGDAKNLMQRGYSQIPSDSQIRRQLQRGKVLDQAEGCLDQEEHWLHASTKHRRGVSVEQPHNMIHVYLGFPMTSVKYAAFYPAFFLHHCNIDRLYSKYIEIEGVSNSQREFERGQRSMVRQRRATKNLYTSALTPFKHPTRGDDFMPADTFSTEELGYEYDTLQPDPPQRMTAIPTYAVFENVMPLEMNYKSYGLYVFVLAPDTAAAWQPGAGVDEWLEQPEFAGSGAIFGGKGKECANCVERDPYNVLVDVSEALLAQGVSRYEAVIRVMCCDEEGSLSELNQTPVPVPYLNGPFFDSVDHMAKQEDSAGAGAVGGDNKAIQLWLHKKGWFQNGDDEANVDGWFGPNTQAAVKAYQKWAGIDVDGIAGPLTKQKMLQVNYVVNEQL